MKKFFKVFGIGLLSVLVIANVLILATGNTHLYKGIRYTYLAGEKGPTIDDLKKFPYSTIEASPVEVPLHEDPANYKDVSDAYVIQGSTWDSILAYETVALLVVKNNLLILEWYADDYGSEDVVNSFSMSKSFVSLMIGAAVTSGYINSIDDRAVDYLPENFTNVPEDVTIKHLLQMSSGIGFDESYTSPFAFPAKGYYGSDLRGLVQGYERDKAPGEEWFYKGGDTQLLAFILEEATGMKISEYFKREVWNKIGATSNAYWSLDKEGGDEKASCCLYATARDFARIGKLILNEGAVGENQIISPDYMKACFEPVGLPNKRDGKTVDYYGLQWWMGEVNGMKIKYARGILGQYIIAVPQKNAVVVRLGRKRSEQKIDGIHPSDIALYLDILK